MAEWHLQQIENALNSVGWKIASRLEGDNYRISAVWEIARNSTKFIDFEGLSENGVLPIERAYGCRIRNTSIDLYFHKKGTSRENAFSEFTKQLERL